MEAGPYDLTPPSVPLPTFPSFSPKGALKKQTVSSSHQMENESAFEFKEWNNYNGKTLEERVNNIISSAEVLLTHYDKQHGGGESTSKAYKTAVQQLEDLQELKKKEIENISSSFSTQFDTKKMNKRMKKINKETLKGSSKIIANYHNELFIEKKGGFLASAALSRSQQSSLKKLVMVRAEEGKLTGRAAGVAMRMVSHYYAKRTPAELQEMAQKGNLMASLALIEAGYKQLLEEDAQQWDARLAVQESTSDSKELIEEKQQIRERRPALMKMRKGAVALGNAWLVARQTDTKKIQKQLASIEQQQLSAAASLRIDKKLQLDGIKQPVQLAVTPIDATFDSYYPSNVPSSGLAGAGGHLVNGRFHHLKVGEGAELVVIRHAILSNSRFDVDPVARKQDAKRKAEALLRAAVIHSIRESGHQVDSVTKWHQLVVSESLVTPDFMREVWNGSHSEAHMLKEQQEALSELNGKTLELLVNGHSIQVTCKVISANHGVNELARLGVGPVGLGATQQKEANGQAIKELHNQFDFLSKKSVPKEKQASFNQHRAALSQLFNDIDQLSGHRRNYLAGENAYELPTRLLLVGQELQALNGLISTDKRTEQEEPHYDGVALAANCMSGKDRTGVLVASTQAMELMKHSYGRYPSHEELNTSGPLQNQFVRFYLQLLQEGGGLEVTAANTGVKGYKSDPLIYPDSPVWGSPENKAKLLADLAGGSAFAKS